jgi:hypothetical protein
VAKIHDLMVEHDITYVKFMNGGGAKASNASRREWQRNKTENDFLRASKSNLPMFADANALNKSIDIQIVENAPQNIIGKNSARSRIEVLQ